MQRVIDINQIKGNFFGGLPYNIGWDFNGGEDASKLTVSVVSENGVYATPTPSFNKTEKINIGNFSFEGYLVKYSFQKSPNQKTLELEYIDKSINLEKWYVGLHTKHGDKNKNNTPRLILVGKPYHPCDKNQDSMLDYSEVSNETQIDYCDPCPFMPEDKYKSACDPILSEFEIFDVYYTFNELLSKIPSEFSINIKDPSRFNKFKNQHVGTLKSVLSSWCSDLGLSFYWDPFLSKLVFLDRTSPIQIPQPPSNWEIIDLTQGKSILNTFSRGFIGNYEKAGEIKSYQCTNETIEAVRCLNISDLYEPKPNGFTNTKAPNESDIRELTIAISYLGSAARNAFLWFWFYQINSAAELKEKYFLKYNLEKKEAEKQKGKILKPFGEMKIRAVYHAQGDQTEVANFELCKSKLQQADRDYMDADDKKKGYSETNPSYYFFVAEVNETLASKQLDSDLDMAKNFFGKYWFKRFQAKVPGGSNSNREVTVEAPDGNATWHRSDDDLKGSPIFNFGHEENSLIGKLAKEVEKDAKENEALEQKYRDAAKSFTADKTMLKSLNSFILLERDGKWFPNEDFLSNYNSLFQWFEEVSPKVFSSEDGRPEFLLSIHPEAQTNQALKLFICRDLTKQNGLPVEFSIEQHPLEPKSRKQKTEEEQDVFGNTVVINNGSWGLIDSKTVKIKFGGDRGITFFCPTQSFGNNEIVKNTTRDKTASEKTSKFDTGKINLGTDDGSAGYAVFVSSSSELHKVIPKIQYIYTKPISNLDVAKIDYNIKQITEDNVKILNKGRCLTSKESFDTYAQSIAEFSNYKMDQPQSTMSFKTAGIFPLNYNCSQGLSSLQINIADDGVYTSYSFEDLIVQPPSDEYMTQYLKDSLKTKTSISSLNPVTTQNLSNIKTAVGYTK